MPKHYVNIERLNDKEKHHSQFVHVGGEMDTSESENKEMWFFLEPDGNNLHLKKKEWFPPWSRPSNFSANPPFGVQATIKDKKTVAKLRLSVAGGDKFKISDGKLADKSDATDSGMEQLEVWRKLYVRAGKMECNGSAPNLAIATSELAKVFVELEQIGGMNRIPAQGWYDDPTDPVYEMNRRCSGDVPRPDQTIFVAFVDRCGRSGVQTYKTVQIDTAKIKASYVVDWPLKSEDGSTTFYTWPTNEDNWVTGTIMLSHENEEMHIVRTDLHNFFFKKPMWKHPEGTMTDHLYLDFSPLASDVDEWIRNGNGKAHVQLNVRILQNEANGSAWKGCAMISTRDCYEACRRSGVGQTTAHEIGHLLGLVPKELPVYSADAGDYESDTPNPGHDAAHGAHCHRGCMMYYQSVDDRPSTFCGGCQQILKRSRMERIGDPW